MGPAATLLALGTPVVLLALLLVMHVIERRVAPPALAPAESGSAPTAGREQAAAPRVPVGSEPRATATALA